MNRLKILTAFVFGLVLIGCSASADFKNSVNDPLELKLNGKKQLSFITYNIQDLFGKSEENLTALVDYLNNEKYDFVMLQELFTEKSRNHIINNIDTTVYSSIVARIDYSSFPHFIFNDAGLFYMSRYPLVDLSELEFENGVKNSGYAIHKMLSKEVSLSTDFLANKSVAGSLYKLNDSTKIFLCSTHVQALGSSWVKNKQLRQIKRFIAQAVYQFLKSGIVDKPENLIVMLAGDFNSDAYSERRMEILQTLLGNPRDLHSEYKPEGNEFTFHLRMFGQDMRFDYIFAYDSLDSVPLKRVSVNSINATDIEDVNNDRLSDHSALKAVVELE